MPNPANIGELRAFLGLASYYRRFIRNFSERAWPLNDLLKRDVKWNWTEQHSEAVTDLKNALTNTPILAYRDESEVLILTTDASGKGLGAIFSQADSNDVNDGGKRIQNEEVIAYASRGLRGAEKNYSITHLEGLAVVWAIQHFRHYLVGVQFILVTDHSALLNIFNSENPVGRIARWSMYLREYDYVVRHRKVSLNPADALSRLPVNIIGEDEDGSGEGDGVDGEAAVDIDDGQRRRIRQAMDLAKWITIYQYLTELRYLNDCDERMRRKIRRWSAKFRAENGKLFLRRPRGEYPIEVLHTGNAEATVQRVHEESHLGINNTWRKLKERFTGPQLFEVVKKVVQTCVRCQERKNRERSEELRPIESGRVFEIVGIDAIGPLPTTRRGNRYILVAIDYLSRYPMARAVPSIRMEDTIDFLFQEVISHFGCPRQLISDRGANFVSELTTAYLRRLGIRASPTTSYRPQSNGMVERAKQTLVQTLAKIGEKHIDWDDKLEAALLAFRTMPNAATGKTPMELLIGQLALTPSVWTPRSGQFVEGAFEDELEWRTKKIEETLPEVRAEVEDRDRREKRKMKERYDSGVTKRCYSVGDEVLVYQHDRFKFDPRWVGPYTVSKVLGKGAYVIRDASGVDLSTPVNGDNLRPYSNSQSLIPEVVANSSTTAENGTWVYNDNNIHLLWGKEY
ncbi:uncharacterized protein VTP21DRAFT_4184 [Calcarisporiella thermophila]|uniref:uncharacterized protein n=1 Tax=Calcarisporiella thermophila TaxID=911321 RepID=UPI003742E455